MNELAWSRPILGVVSIVGDAFAIFFRRFGLMFSLAFVPAFLAEFVPLVLLPGLAADVAADNLRSLDGVVRVSVLIVLPLVGYAVSTGLIVLAAFDVLLNRTARPATYIRLVLANLLPILILSLISALLTVLGAIALVVPGLWVMAVFYLVVPAIVIEGSGFGGLGRSARLTMEYRWPIVGLLIILVVVELLADVALTELPQAFLFSAGGIWLVLIGRVVVSAITGGIVATATAMTYARLREIKDGIAVDSLADVFA